MMRGSMGVSALALAVSLAMGVPGAGTAAAETPLERGRALVNGIAACGNCHTPQGPNGPAPGMEMAGGMPIADTMFTAYAANLTPDPETGIGRWTDEQIITAMREGKRPDGSIIGPPMPFEFYRGISDADARAIVAYLRSLKPVRNKVAPSEFKFPLPPAWGPPVGSVPEVSRADKVAYGAYLAGPVGHCMECHTPMKAGGGRDMTKLGAGGQSFTGPWGVTVARNITQDRQHGIGAWTDDQIKRAITTGVSADGTHLMPPMAFGYYRTLSGEEQDALVAYLRTVPAQN
ncbi:c-type cytochrome [Azospirillum oleiclasticum]|nr:cytochrome c [Azospirillum oleiclasticum]